MSFHFTGPARRTARRLALAAALVATALATVSPGSVQAEGDRDDGVSSRTGVQYWGNFNCVGRRPLFVHAPPSQAVEIELEFINDDGTGVAVRRDIDPAAGEYAQRTRMTAFAGVNATFENDTVFVLRDRLPGDSDWNEVLRLGPSDCQDYTAQSVGSYQSIDPTRAFDSRPTSLTNHTGAKPGAATSITIAAADMPDRPDEVIAVALTVTMAAPEQRGFAQVYPTGLVRPGSTASVNTSGPGGAVGNLAVSAVGNDGSVSIYTSTRSHLVVDIVGYFVESGASTTGGRLETITSKRLFDTRSGAPVNSNGTKLSAGETRTVDLTALESGLPAGATAAVVNVTSTAANGQGFIQAAAAGQLVPGASAVVNLGSGQTKGGLTIVPLSSDGSIDVHSSAGAEVIIDLAGWFTSDTAAAGTDGLFVALQPERVADTRGGSNTTNLYWNHPYTPGSGLYQGVVPFHAVLDAASAVLVNVTAISPDRPGFIQLSDRSNSDRQTSNVNFTEPGSTVANAAVVQVGQSAGIYLAWPYGPQSVATARNAGVALDISGYFTN